MKNIIETHKEIMPEPYHVYVQTDERGRIAAVNSSAFISADWGTEIDSGYDDQHHHAQGNYFSQPIYTEDGIPRYKLVEGSPVERTEEEIEADRVASHIEHVSRPSPDDISRLMVMMAQDVPGEVALSVQSMYNLWETGKRYGYDGCEKIVKVPNLFSNFGDPYFLYRCNQPHTSQADWQPQVTPALWTRIDKSHEGGESDPIPATRGMEYVYGKYYLDLEDGKTYLCKRMGEPEGGVITLHYLPHELIGHYFEEV